MKKHKKRWIVFLCIFLAGCWDNIGIEDRAFIIGTAIDIDEENDQKYKITNQIVIPSGISNPTGGGQGDKAFLNITLSGNSVHTINHDISTLTSKIPFYKHLVILVVSEEAAKKKHVFTDALDSFIRDPNVNRSIKVVISDKEAKKILENNPAEEKLPAIYFNTLIEENMKQFGMKTTYSLGDIDEYLLEKRSFIVPYVKLFEQIEFNAGAVFHGYKDKFVGILNQDEMTGLELIRGKSKNNVIDIQFKHKPVSFDIYKTKAKTKIDTTNIHKIKVSITLEIDGVIKETIGYMNLLKEHEIKSLAKEVSQEAKKYMFEAINKAQKELNADVFDVIKTLRMKHYDTYTKVRDEWEHGENYFSKIKFDIDVKTNIRSIGALNKTDRK